MGRSLGGGTGKKKSATKVRRGVAPKKRRLNNTETNTDKAKMDVDSVAVDEVKMSEMKLVFSYCLFHVKGPEQQNLPERSYHDAGTTSSLASEPNGQECSHPEESFFGGRIRRLRSSSRLLHTRRLLHMNVKVKVEEVKLVVVAVIVLLVLLLLYNEGRRLPSAAGTTQEKLPWGQSGGE